MTITTTTPATAHVTLEQIDSITDAIATKEDSNNIISKCS